MGVPGSQIHINTSPTKPRIAIDQKHHFHMPTPWFALPITPRPMITPHTFATRPPPIECDVFHTLIFVASSFGGTQNAMSFAHGGKPVPWKNWLSTRRMPNVQTSGREARAVSAASADAQERVPPPNSPAICGAKPNARLMSVQVRSPKQSIFRGLTLSPTMPFTNFEMP